MKKIEILGYRQKAITKQIKSEKINEKRKLFVRPLGCTGASLKMMCSSCLSRLSLLTDTGRMAQTFMCVGELLELLK